MNSNNGQAPHAAIWKVDDLIINPDVTGAVDELIVLSFDLLSFDWSDNTTSWLYLESVSIEEITFVH